MSNDRIVVVGASLAGVRAAESLRRRGFTGTVTLVGEELHFPPVDRPPLSKAALAAAVDHVPGRLRVDESLDVELLLGRRAVQLDLAGRSVRLADGTGLSYDGLVVATGAHARTLRGTEGYSNVHVIRTVDDALRLRTALARAAKVAVIGAGVLGCETAATCRGLGLDVALIDSVDTPMVRVLGCTYGQLMATRHRGQGVRLYLGRRVLGVHGRPLADGVVLDGDEVVDADLVVVSVGALPATGWLEGSGLQLDDGVICDECCFAAGTDRTVVAAGDVARWHHPLLRRAVRMEHWTNAAAQGQAAAQNLLAALTRSDAPTPYAALPYYWSDQYDWKLQVVGSVGPDTVPEEGAVEDGRFVVSYHSGGQLVGALCVNRPSQVPRWRSRILAALS